MRKPKFVVADTMDLWIGMARADLIELLKEVDMLILNDSEAKQLTEEDNLIRAGKKIVAMGPRYVAVKKGEHGCLLFGRDGEFFSTGAFPLETDPRSDRRGRLLCRWLHRPSRADRRHLVREPEGSRHPGHAGRVVLLRGIHPAPARKS